MINVVVENAFCSFLLEEEELVDGSLDVHMLDCMGKHLIHAQNPHFGATIGIIGDTVADDKFIQATGHDPLAGGVAHHGMGYIGTHAAGAIFLH